MLEKYKVPREKIVNLNILDIYGKNDPRLIKISEEKLWPYIERFK